MLPPLSTRLTAGAVCDLITNATLYRAQRKIRPHDPCEAIAGVLLAFDKRGRRIDRSREAIDDVRDA